jgi:hypothetical protein
MTNAKAAVSCYVLLPACYGQFVRAGAPFKLILFLLLMVWGGPHHLGYA